MTWSRDGGRWHLSRRTMLRGMLGGAAVALGLPRLEAMFAGSTAQAADAFAIKRFGLFFWGNGNRPEWWTPDQAGLGEAWSLSRALTPLAPHKAKLTVVTGTAVKLPNDAPHSSGAAGLLTGAPLGDAADDYSFTAPSLDQVIASGIGGETVYRSLETGLFGASGRSYNGPNSRNPPETSPLAFFDRVFGPTFREPGQGVVDPKLGLRRSALDAVMADVNRLRARVGAADKARLDQHFSGLRDLEQRLARFQEEPLDLAACVRPDAPAADWPYVDGRAPLAEANVAFAKMLAMAFACDQTRVFSHWYSDPVNDQLYDGVSAGHHDLTHNEGGEQPQVADITERIMGSFADLLTELDALPEGDGTLLDHCAILGCSEVSLGQTHSILNMPILVGGSCSGALRADQHYASLGQESVSKVALTLIQAVGIRAANFGVEDGFVDAPIASLLV